MNATAEMNRIGTMLPRRDRPTYGSGIPTRVDDPLDSPDWLAATVRRISGPVATTGLSTLFVRPVPAPTELAGDREVLEGPSAEDRLHARLLSYRKLPHDWDGRGAVPPSLDAVSDAVQFLVTRPPDVRLPFPQIASDGEVGLYWRTGDVHAEVGFSGDGELSYYARYTPADGESVECGRDGYDLGTGRWPQDLMLILNKLET